MTPKQLTRRQIDASPGSEPFGSRWTRHVAGGLPTRLVARDKCSLDIFWLRDESLEDSDNLPEPAVIAAEIVEDLKAALEQFAEIQIDLAKT